MTDDDMKFLGDELHELVDGIGSTSSAAARDRARRGIARHQRNRRAAAGAAAAVVVIAGIAFVAVDRDSKDSRQPIGTTTTPTSAPTTTSSSTTAPSTTVPGSAIVSTIPALSELPAATASYTKTFAWGTGDDQVAFHTPQGEGASGGPVAFTATAAGDIVMLDHSSSRIVRFEHGTPAANHIALASPAVTAAVFDKQGRVIVAAVGDLAVFSPDGSVLAEFPGLSVDAINKLEVVDQSVYSVPEDGKTRTLLLRDEGGGYKATRGAKPEPRAIPVAIDDSRRSLSIAANGRQYRITANAAVYAVTAVKELPDSALTFVLQLDQLGNPDADAPLNYVIGHIDSAGHATYAKVSAATGYLINGPGFVINDDGVAVMGSTTTGGVTVAYYPFS
jgi:hypothetical protein